jgi:transposase InsO family protein
MIAKLAIDPSAVPNFSLNNGILRYNGRIWIGKNSNLQTKLLHACHSSALGGHSGVPVTYARMKQLFAWPGMKSAVQQFVKVCRVCQQAKPDRSKLPGKLQPLPVPSGAWQTVSIDFVEGLPTSGHANCILVVIDSFTKYGHFIALHHPFTALSVAKLFLHNIYKLHGMPLAIVSDRDRIFTSSLWKELFALAGVQLQMSSSYHPQSDGQTERLNQTMETFLRCFVNACPSKWLHWLSLAEFWYNSCTHSALDMSPFEALYGYKPRHFGVEALQPVQSVELSVWMNEKKFMTTLIKQHLSRAKLRMKKQADKLRSERTFAVGDQVFLKLQPYVQTSLASRSNQKLAFKFFGPFRIVERIGPVAYKLQLPASSSIHPVFHVSQLKKAITEADEVIDYFPDDLNSPRVPEVILQKRVVHHENSPVHQVLIKWSGWPAALATWEDFTALKQQFPHAPAWGQAVSQEGEIVTTGPAIEGNTVRRSSRVSKANQKWAGPEWLNVLGCAESGLAHVSE